MTIIDLDLAKAHLRVTGDDEDTIIDAYLGASERAAANYLNRNIYETVPSEDQDGISMNEPILASCLLTLGHLYANREAVSTETNTPKELPMGVKYMLDPYRLDLGV
jgi:hypothetical protein